MYAWTPTVTRRPGGADNSFIFLEGPDGDGWVAQETSQPATLGNMKRLAPVNGAGRLFRGKGRFSYQSVPGSTP
jgi:hypothetical protein